jgi:hypothetical protein
MPLAGFETTIPVFKRAKIFHALDRAATVTSPKLSHYSGICLERMSNARININGDSRCPGRGSIHVSPEYKT